VGLSADCMRQVQFYEFYICSASLNFFLFAEPRLHTTFKSAVEALLVLSMLAHTNIKGPEMGSRYDEVTSKDVWSFIFYIKKLAPPHTVSAKKKGLRSEILSCIA
jgi:hypothetical protein